MDAPGNLREDRLREIVDQCLRLALPEASPLPAEDEDWIASGALDSMAHVDVLLCIEKAAGLTNVFNRVEANLPRSRRSVFHALRAAISEQKQSVESQRLETEHRGSASVGISGWGIALGSVRVKAAALEGEYSLAPGTLEQRAGIESVARVKVQEDEITLAHRAVKAALDQSGVDAGDVDWIVATSETFLGYPSLGSLLHSRLLARDTCGVLDIGGACVGLLHCLAVARSLVVAGMASRVLIVTADVHSRPLAAGRVPGEFGGLFGDGASAFVLGPVDAAAGTPPYRLGEFQFGCAGTFAAALAVGTGASGEVALKFEGEALARAAVGRLERIIADLELRSGVPRAQVSSFATHQPNPRLVELLARQAEVPLEKFPVVAKTCGNLGSSTCGVALSMALVEHGGKPADQRGPIFLAAVGPGMLWGGGILY